MKLTIGFSSPKSGWMLFGRAIEAVEKRPFSHAFCVYTDPFTGVEMVFQAAHGIVHICPYDRLKAGNNIVKTYDLNFSVTEFKTFYTFMLSSLGKPYAWKQILGILISKTFRCKNPFDNNTSSDFCSQLMVYVCRLKGIPIDKEANTVTPSDLDRILQDNI